MTSGSEKAKSRNQLTDARLRSIRRRLRAATPGPWRYDGCSVTDQRRTGDSFSMEWIPNGIAVSDERVNMRIDADAELIAHAPADLAMLVAEIERLREVIRVRA